MVWIWYSTCIVWHDSVMVNNCIISVCSFQDKYTTEDGAKKISADLTLQHAWCDEWILQYPYRIVMECNGMEHPSC